MEIKYNTVYYSYQKQSLDKSVLKNISLEIKPEKINVLVGNSGSGKTTFINLLDALLLPSLGSIQIGNYTITKNSQMNLEHLRFEVGVVLENPKEQFFLPTVKKEIAFSLNQFSYKLEQINKRISDALKLVGLNDSYLNRNPMHLSGGEMKKVAIASVLVLNPKVLVFDEPMIDLDGISKKSFLKMLKILKNRYHKTIIITTNNTTLAHTIADYVFVLYNGEKVLEGNKYDVFLDETLEQYGLTRPNVIEFSNKVLKQKNVRLGFRDDINDLIKDIYRHVS